MRDCLDYRHVFRLPAGREVAFDIFSSPSHLNELTPPWFDLQPIGPLPSRLDVGLEIPYRLRWRGVAMRWTSRLTDWHDLHFFAYEQARGPFRFFRHEHHFSTVDGGTEIVDRVLFRTPAGRLVDRWIALPDLRRIFSFREGRARALLCEPQAGACDRDASRIPWTSASSSAIERPT